MKKEFHNIQLIKRETDWQKDATKKSYKALTDDSSIFVYFSAADYKLLVFKKDHSFQIENDEIIYDESEVREKLI